MNQLYGRHAVACVWFIKYMTDNVIFIDNHYIYIERYIRRIIIE